ncbi:hypothetical protein Hypma_005381 [Hypsizygus marmoreus]|uniref:Uncharacterized protein n=1 Tax=Hypsizygus marmoreus TaxID=39966 RepID=A0A369K7F8_HYPMA|nr:hypothetical protein Hypma_005381 [Hypsizygus marmoreus]
MTPATSDLIRGVLLANSVDWLDLILLAADQFMRSYWNILWDRMFDTNGAFFRLYCRAFLTIGMYAVRIRNCNGIFSTVPRSPGGADLGSPWDPNEIVYEKLFYFCEMLKSSIETQIRGRLRAELESHKLDPPNPESPGVRVPKLITIQKLLSLMKDQTFDTWKPYMMENGRAVPLSGRAGIQIMINHPLNVLADDCGYGGWLTYIRRNGYNIDDMMYASVWYHTQYEFLEVFKDDSIVSTLPPAQKKPIMDIIRDLSKPRNRYDTFFFLFDRSRSAKTGPLQTGFRRLDSWLFNKMLDRIKEDPSNHRQAGRQPGSEVSIQRYTAGDVTGVFSTAPPWFGMRGPDDDVGIIEARSIILACCSRC